jgi:two-component system sensor histidine kinase PilS (NtrC family)
MTDIPATASPTVDFWRSLRYFNLYRLMLAGIFVLVGGLFGSSLSLGTHNWKMFFIASLLYAMAAGFSFVLLKLQWPRFNLQLAGQVIADIVGLTLLSYASGGIQSSIGLLLLVSLAAAGLVSRGKITLFFAALASIATLLEHAGKICGGQPVVGTTTRP